MRQKTAVIACLLLLVALPACADSKGGDKDKAQAAADKGIAATIGNVTISIAELEKAAEGELRQLENQRYEILNRQLQQMIDDRLITNEAATRKIPPTDLVKMEVTDKAGVPSEEEMKKYFADNESKAQGKPFEYWKPMIERELTAMRTQTRQEAFMTELKSKTPTRIMLDPPRVVVNIPAGEPAKGPANAVVTLVEFSDFQCPFCKRVHPTLERLMSEYKDQLRFVYRDYPLSIHQRAVPASEAARCAIDQNKYWEYYENLMVMQGDLSDADLLKRAKDVGMDEAAFKTCFDSKKHATAVQAAMADGQQLGVTGTPTFFINGRMLVGAKSYPELKAVIDDELARAGGGVAKGS